MRECKLCGSNKEQSEYYLADKKRGYLDTVCKECRREQAKSYRLETAEDKLRREESRVYKTKDPEYRQNYYQENIERIKKRSRRRNIEKKDEIAEYKKEYAKRNKSRLSAYKNKHYHDNKPVYKFRAFRRKMAIKNSPFRATQKEIELLLNKFDDSCVLTGSKDIHLDHFIPIATGYGDTSLANLIPLDRDLNLSKSKSNPFEWIKTRNDIDKDKFLDVVFYLAELNGLTTEEYEAHVYNCFD